jgi:uncharacterized protein (TIGR03437 family)
MLKVRFPRLLCLAAVTASFGAQAFAQTSVPSQYQALYTELQTSMQSVEPTLTPGTPGRTNFPFAAELLQANGNTGLLLLNPGTRNNYLREMQALKSLGITALNVSVGFPLFYQPFYEQYGLSQDYQPMVDFFAQVVVDAHSMGFKVSMETQCLYPGYYGSASGFNVSEYFSTLSLDQFEAGRAAQVAVIYSQIKPDYLDLGSEPDTEASNSGQTALLTPSVWAQAITSYVQAVPSGTHNPKLGAGVGNWRVDDGMEYVQDEIAIPGLDYIDLHGYPVVTVGGVNTFQFLTQLLATAKAAGKPVAMSEFWLLKISSADFLSNNSSDPTTASLNAYSFFEPLDQEFLTDLWEIGNQYDFLYGSAFWSQYYWTYLSVDSAPAPGSTLETAAQSATSQALASGQIDTLGTAIRSLTGSGTPGLTIASSANYSTLVAVGSLASLFGANLSSSTAGSTSLGTSLDGVTVKVTDSAGTTAAADLLYVSPGQVNFVVPSGLTTGSGTVSLSSGSGSAQTASINLLQVAPGIFSANGSGSGTAAAESVIAASNGALVYTDVYGSCSSAGCLPVPINVSSGKVYLVLFGTGISGAGQSAVSATVNGQPASIAYAGPQGGFAGLDQVNILLPASLAGAGTVNVQLNVSGLTSNTVTIDIQ